MESWTLKQIIPWTFYYHYHPLPSLSSSLLSLLTCHSRLRHGQSLWRIWIIFAFESASTNWMTSVHVRIHIINYTSYGHWYLLPQMRNLCLQHQMSQAPDCLLNTSPCIQKHLSVTPFNLITDPFWVLIIYNTGVDPGFFLGGVAPLRNDVTDGWGKLVRISLRRGTPLRNDVTDRWGKQRLHLREGGCAPPAPSP